MATDLQLEANRKLAAKLRQCMDEKGHQPKDVAAACGVKPPSVYDWLQFGRIAKRHFSTLSKLHGYPVSWWLDAEEDEKMLSKDERTLVDYYRDFDDEFRRKLLEHAELLRSAAERSNNQDDEQK
jgi:hypothetical protein